MKSSLALTAITVVIVGALAISAVPAEPHRGRQVKPGHGFVDENKDGVCGHAPPVSARGTWQKDEKASTNWNCPRAGGKGDGWGMKGGKISPNLPDSGNSPSGGATK
jgi:hypothetical protein